MKKAIAVGLLQLPLQVFISLMVQAVLINSASVEIVKWWYLLLALTPIFVVLEFAYPQIAISYFNGRNTSRNVLPFLKNSIFTITFFQLLFFLIYIYIIDGVGLELIIFFLSMYLRSLGNLLISIIYAKGFVLTEKVYKLLFSSLFPILFLIMAQVLEIDRKFILTIWFLCSLLLFLYAMFYFSKIEKNSNLGIIDSPICIKDNVRLILTTLPGVFIFNMSIYYLELFYDGENVIEIVTFGLFLQLLNVFNVLNSIFPSVFVPALSKKFHAGDRIEEDVFTILFVNKSISIFLIVGLIFFGEPLLSLVIKESRINFEVIVFFFAASVLIESIQVTLTSISIGTGCYKYHIPSFFSALLVLLFSYYLVPSYGSPGLILSILSSQVFTCLPVNTYISSKRLGIRTYKVFFVWISILFSLIGALIIKNFVCNYLLLIYIYIAFLFLYLLFLRKDISSVTQYLINR
ncbi:hypothetical protein FG475_07380 [Vibrio navarrensis]|nr:hypothetical protein [Vibrio navarrensis]